MPLLEPETPINSYHELIGFLDQLNSDIFGSLAGRVSFAQS